MNSAEVRAWVYEFFSRVSFTARKYHVRKVETRPDCCIFLAGTGSRVSWNELDEEADMISALEDDESDQVTRVLEFAVDIAAEAASLRYCEAQIGHKVRLGVAHGGVT
eukprot:CAMPEP_0113675724 /NCGR_PEP_ID=MMETSP0038_2-20120614/8192_1 /TAXON_ID=2898 /ORGANISM="Cryptomonas paramecium" /LENGTH=107 /DNA_ID=CAMNT_0000592565 /DNA_START=294 /DNA_END=614 /DNA_ORIENTATION=+ /assembly_acc=CAM_ASM_000170